ncbi:cation:proton antiporter [Streptomyces lunaelactis]|uniref:cation:proton antiporter n=1 Tax=Streptomyces lunaelactis TaxID=1535768 RepID=UPI0015858E43|nr:cation:proton antiporter [Streptomyces lunaelactis]NUK00034.1 cation:proton antiporter [Streptomyces lunaelactis]NUK14358.1 cation:proton antiporter [Streptomyces lunaelactis]NUK21225.1 cation:proton antiporter [Streptomyces lunaelactis]NUK32712.1 cation:proton antiporter [Streptomyces lunaelactis]NUK39539.1 cation:proton antiporter [Streptomyces lunaelactis]
MVLVVVFGVALLIAVLLSGLAARTVLSTSFLFLVGGALVSDGFLGLIHITPDSDIVAVTADLALFAVLFTDGMHVSFSQLRCAWRNPARALGLGMPLACAGMALITHYLVGLDWTTSFLVGAVLAPTDPVFASAIVGRKEVPARLRQLLNVESGINDGLALPVVLLLIAAAGPAAGQGQTSGSRIALELALGLAFGVLLPLVVNGLVRFRLLGAEPKLQPLLPLATGVILYALCHLTHANPYLAAFSAGAVLASLSPESKTAFASLGESLAELAKFAALLIFGALLTPQLFGDLSLGGYVAVVLAIVLIRPASLLLSLVGAHFDRREKLAAAWFGPKGFASVVYGLLVLQSGIPQAEQAYTLSAVCIAFSIVAHSSTDVPVARMFRVNDLVGIPDVADAESNDVPEQRGADRART